MFSPGVVLLFLAAYVVGARCKSIDCSTTADDLIGNPCVYREHCTVHCKSSCLNSSNIHVYGTVHYATVAGEVAAEAELIREQPSLVKTPPLLPPGKPIWFRQFQLGKKWLSETVIATEGNLMVKVETPLGNQGWHVDQLRVRLASTTPEKNASRVGFSLAPYADAREASATPNSSPATPRSPVSTQETWTPEAVRTLLRRSTRTRRPPEVSE
ncbi:hypothetical protein MTO96_024383 [Rhipicephalus appendiculatus]